MRFKNSSSLNSSPLATDSHSKIFSLSLFLSSFLLSFSGSLSLSLSHSLPLYVLSLYMSGHAYLTLSLTPSLPLRIPLYPFISPLPSLPLPLSLSASSLLPPFLSPSLLDTLNSFSMIWKPLREVVRNPRLLFGQFPSFFPPLLLGPV